MCGRDGRTTSGFGDSVVQASRLHIGDAHNSERIGVGSAIIAGTVAETSRGEGGC